MRVWQKVLGYLLKIVRIFGKQEIDDGSIKVDPKLPHLASPFPFFLTHFRSRLTISVFQLGNPHKMIL